MYYSEGHYHLLLHSWGKVCIYVSKSPILLMFAICKYTKSFYWEHLKSFVFLTDRDYRGRKIVVANPYSYFPMKATSLAFYS